MANFTLEEFTFSQAAARRGLDNRVPPALLASAQTTLAMLERIRAFLSERKGHPVPLLISSGYRSPEVNAAVGGSARSDHMQALAADWTAPAFGTPYQVCAALVPEVDNLRIGQLIHEFGRWVHTSVPKPLNLVNRIITIDQTGTRIGIA